MTTGCRNPDLIPYLLNEARQTGILPAAALDQNHRLIAMPQTAGEPALATALKDGLNAPATPNDPATEHRRTHRPGHPAKIEPDTELQAFIRAGIDALAFKQITAAIKASFSPARHVGRSTMHRGDGTATLAAKDILGCNHATPADPGCCRQGSAVPA